MKTSPWLGTTAVAQSPRHADAYVNCHMCHGGGAVSGGASPDLRASPIILSDVAFEAVLRKGTLVERGMPAFPDLSNRHLEALQHYIRQRARISLGLLGDGL